MLSALCQVYALCPLLFATVCSYALCPLRFAKVSAVKVVILCGGQGTRLKEKTDSIPKPLVEVGGRPILWHIMKIYSAYGFNDFILCLGYKGDLIKAYFKQHHEKDWNLEFADTGEATQTGGRIKRIEPLIDNETFMVTYGDGVADLNLKELLEFHQKHGRIGTVTAANPPSQFGLLNFDEKGCVQKFQEKPQIDRWINGGFFVFQKTFFKYLTDDCILEKEPLERLSSDKQLFAWKHSSFWKCMDTYKDTVVLNELWNGGKAPWKTWS